MKIDKIKINKRKSLRIGSVIAVIAAAIIVSNVYVIPYFQRVHAAEVNAQ